MFLTFWYTASAKLNVAQKFQSEQMYSHQFDLLILVDKNDMNLFQDILIRLRKPLRFECDKWKKKL